MSKCEETCQQQRPFFVTPRLNTVGAGAALARWCGTVHPACFAWLPGPGHWTWRMEMGGDWQQTDPMAEANVCCCRGARTGSGIDGRVLLPWRLNRFKS